MGTMLAAKETLGKHPTKSGNKFRRRIFYDELQFILDRRLLDHTMVNCMV